MSTEPTSDTRGLLRDILILQLKLLIEAARDLALSPLTLAAGLLDLALAKTANAALLPAACAFRPAQR